MSRPARIWCCSIGWISRRATWCCRCPAITAMQRGTFALRSPARPNPIALSVVKLLRHRGQQAYGGRPRLPRRHAAPRHQALLRLDRLRAGRGGRLAPAAKNKRRKHQRFIIGSITVSDDSSRYVSGTYEPPVAVARRTNGTRDFIGEATDVQQVCRHQVQSPPLRCAALVAALSLWRVAQAAPLFAAAVANPVGSAISAIPHRAGRAGPRTRSSIRACSARSSATRPTKRPAPSSSIRRTPYLYYVLGNGQAIRYGIGVGREGFTWSGVKHVARKAEWPDWIPPQEMIERQPYLPRFDGRRPRQSARRPRHVSRRHRLPHPRHQRSRRPSASTCRPAASA